MVKTTFCGGVFSGMLLLSFGALAADAIATATLKASDTGSDSALLNASAWKNGTATFPDPQVDYFVGGGKTLYSKSTQDIVFAGRSLIIGDSAKSESAAMELKANTDYGDRILQFTGEEGLVLSYGNIQNWYTCCTVISGKVSVTSTDSKPFIFYSGGAPHASSKRKVNNQLEGELTSDENAKIFFCYAKTGNSVYNARYRLLCDSSKYLGIIEARQLYQGESTSRNRVTLEIGACDFGGTMKMNKRTTLDMYTPDSVVKVKNLNLKAGSALSLRWDAASQKGAGLAVEGSLSVESPVEVRPSRHNGEYGDGGFSVALLKAPEGVELNADDFVFIASQTSDVDEFVSPVVRLEVLKDADGRDVLWAKSLPIKRSSADDVSGKTCSLCYNSGAPVSNWPDGDVAKPEYDYVSAHTILSLGSSAAESVFPGNSLTFKSANIKELALRCPVVVIPDLRIDLSSGPFLFQNWGGGDKTTNSFASAYGTVAVKGKLNVISSIDNNKLTLYSGNRGLIRIDSDISGNGNIEVKVDSNSTLCYMELAGDNSKWKGRLIASQGSPNVEPHASILFREAKSLGGAMSSFTRNAIDLGDSGILRPLQSVAISEPTRGIRVGGNNCRFAVNEGITFTVAQRISYSGKLTKTGTGTLVLGGGRPLFADNETTSPTEGKNLLHIAEGALSPLSSEAFERIAVSFAEGTRIVLAVPDSYEEGVGRYGMALTSEFSSITLPVDGLPVALAEGVEPPSSSFAIPICTVRTADAAAVRDGLVLENRNPFPWYVSEIRERDNSDGTVTFELATSHTGFIISVR